MAIPLLEGCDIAGKDVTGDALLTQRALATYLVAQQAHYHFSVKGNQPTLERDIRLLFEKREAPDFVAVSACEHGRIETRSIWCSMNWYPFNGRHEARRGLSTAGRFGRLRRTGNRPAVDNPAYIIAMLLSLPDSFRRASAARIQPVRCFPMPNDDVRYCSSQCTQRSFAQPQRGS